ncbi:hypothetical protein ACQ4LE_005908 [Meloidogyne hapla]
MKKSEEFGRDYTITVPPPPIDGHLYPIIENHPNEVARGNNLPSTPLTPVFSQNNGVPSGNIGGPPPYNEQQQQQFGCQPMGVRYFVHGQQEGGRSSGNNGGREFHAIHTTLPANGVFYYISSSSSPPGPNCKRNEPFLLIRRRRSSIASIALFSLLASILLIVFVRMHTDLARKRIEQQEVIK